MHWGGRSHVRAFDVHTQPSMSIIMSVWLSIWSSFGIVSLCGIFLSVGSFGGGWHYWVMPPPNRPGLYPFDPLYVRVSSSFIVFSDPCTLVCTRFNKGFELELLLYYYHCDCMQRHYDVTQFEYVLWRHTMHEWVMNNHYKIWIAQGRFTNIILTPSKQWAVCDKLFGTCLAWTRFVLLVLWLYAWRFVLHSQFSPGGCFSGT